MEPANLARLVEQLQDEGALLQYQENAPPYPPQLDSVSRHWKALLPYVQTNEQDEEKEGHGGRLEKLRYARR
ncbi:hypothetical protein ACYU03_03785 [Pseudomonas sp. X10]